MQILLGELIHFLRIKANVSQMDLANYLYVEQSSISRWERGVTQIDKVILLSLAELFQIPLEDFYQPLDTMLRLQKEMDLIAPDAEMPLLVSEIQDDPFLVRAMKASSMFQLVALQVSTTNAERAKSKVDKENTDTTENEAAKVQENPQVAEASPANENNEDIPSETTDASLLENTSQPEENTQAKEAEEASLPEENPQAEGASLPEDASQVENLSQYTELVATEAAEDIQTDAYLAEMDAWQSLPEDFEPDEPSSSESEKKTKHKIWAFKKAKHSPASEAVPETEVTSKEMIRYKTPLYMKIIVMVLVLAVGVLGYIVVKQNFFWKEPDVITVNERYVYDTNENQDVYEIACTYSGILNSHNCNDIATSCYCNWLYGIIPATLPKQDDIYVLKISFYNDEKSALQWDSPKKSIYKYGKKGGF